MCKLIDARKSAMSPFSPLWPLGKAINDSSPHYSSKVASARWPSSRAGSTCTDFLPLAQRRNEFSHGGLYYRQNFDFRIGIVSIVVRAKRRGGWCDDVGRWLLTYLAQMMVLLQDISTHIELSEFGFSVSWYTTRCAGQPEFISSQELIDIDIHWAHDISSGSVALSTFPLKTY